MVDRRRPVSNALDSDWRNGLFPLLKKSAKPDSAKPDSAKPDSAKRSPKKVAAKKTRHSSGVREVEETRALLEKQLHGLYWWVFNACRIKGFIRAKALDAMTSEQNEKRTIQDGDV